MNLYRLRQSVNTGYDTYDSAVVCADSEDDARMMHPSGHEYEWDGLNRDGEWCASEDVAVELIGVAIDGLEKRVICSSYNAG